MCNKELLFEKLHKCSTVFVLLKMCCEHTDLPFFWSENGIYTQQSSNVIFFSFDEKCLLRTRHFKML